MKQTKSIDSKITNADNERFRLRAQEIYRRLSKTIEEFEKLEKNYRPPVPYELIKYHT